MQPQSLPTATIAMMLPEVLIVPCRQPSLG
jgi:hypothetical protein